MLDGRWRSTVERGLEPVGRSLHRAGVTADALTIFGLVVAVATGLVIADGHLVLGVIGLILCGLPDILDGSVARQSGRAGPRGAFFDSVCDRVADAALLLGIAWYLADEDPRLPVLVMAVLALSMLITYERARAESLGFQARGGLMERAERLVLIGIGLAFDILVPILWIMLVLTAITAVQRFVKVWRQATPAKPRRTRHPRRRRRRPRHQDARRVVGRPPSGAAVAIGQLRVGAAPLISAAPHDRNRALASILPRRTAYFAYRAGAEVARLVPEPLGGPFTRAVSAMAPAVFAQRRRQVERNLRRIHGPGYGGRELQRAVAATFDSYGRYFYELFLLPTRSRAWIEQHFVCHGEEHIRAATDAGTGAVLALPHLGNWDQAGAWLAGRGYRVTVVAETLEPPELFDWFVSTRAQLGMRVIPLSPTAGTEVLKALRANEVVCLLCDRDLTGEGISVDFFGERTTMPAGPAMAAVRGGRTHHPRGLLLPPRRGGGGLHRGAPRHRSTRPPPRRHGADHPGPRPPVRGDDPARAHALAPAAAQLAERPARGPARSRSRAMIGG